MQQGGAQSWARCFAHACRCARGSALASPCIFVIPHVFELDPSDLRCMFRPDPFGLGSNGDNSRRGKVRLDLPLPSMNPMMLPVEGSRARSLLRVAFLAGLLGVLSNAADTKIYLDINGVEGDVTDRRYKNQIAVLSYDLVSAPGGGGSMTVSKPVDSSSPILTLLAASGEAVRRAILRVIESSDGKKDTKLTIDMREVLISSVQVSGNNTGAPLETVSMNFAKMKKAFHGEDKKGKK